jgi:hypothetical protein
MAKWNTHIIIFGWCENFLMGISGKSKENLEITTTKF